VKVRENAENIKVRLSEIQDAYEVEDAISEALHGTVKRAVVAQDNMMVLGADVESVGVTGSGEKVFYIETAMGSQTGSMYAMTVSGRDIGTPELADTDVYAGGGIQLENDQLLYFKNVNVEQGKGDLYHNQQVVDYDVHFEGLQVIENTLFYMTDWSETSECGTLKMYKGGEKTKIADDVHIFTAITEKEVLYLRDFGTSYYKGALYRYNGSKSTKLADDVSAYVTINTDKVKGFYYNW
jgi:hypothetical protein